MSTERRQASRMSLALPVRVQGHDPSGTPWEEMASVKDASPAGVALALRHAVSRGQVVLLTMPLPKHFRRYDVAEASYRIYGLVRAVGPDAHGGSRVGVMFLGRQPPKGYEQRPGGLFLLPTDAPPPPPPSRTPERRHDPRSQVPLSLRVKRLEAWAPGPGEEKTIAENIGRRGARVLTTMPVAKGDVVEVEEVDGPFHTRAEVRGVYIGQDHIPRLNLCFLDAEAPPHLVHS